MSSVGVKMSEERNIRSNYTQACPSVYHEFEGPEPIPYDTEGVRGYPRRF